MLKFRTMVADAAEQQTRARAVERGRRRALQDPRRPARHARRARAPPVLARRDPAGAERSARRDEPRRAAAAPVRDYLLLEDWHRRRYRVLPGMTGLWQISGRSSLTFDDLVRLDFYYLENWSIWLDITILAKTLPARRSPHAAPTKCSAEDPRCRICGRPRLPLRLHARLVAAVEGAARGRRRPVVTPYRGKAIESPWWRDGAEPALPRRRRRSRARATPWRG